MIGRKKLTILHGANGAAWSFVVDKYIAHFRDGKKIYIFFDGASTQPCINCETEEIAIELGERITIEVIKVLS